MKTLPQTKKIKQETSCLDRINGWSWRKFEVAVFLLVLILFFSANLWVTGPAYLSDEIGYLSKAAILSGNVIDNAKKWHAGYSIVLAPLFFILRDPAHIWRGVVFFNAAFWGFSFVILSRITRTLWGVVRKMQMALMLFMVLLYPSYIVISGYAFSSSFFTLVYLASVYTFILWESGRKNALVLHSMIVGFLYWIHPTGLAVIFASWASIGFSCFKNRKFNQIILPFAAALGLVLLYQYLIDPLIYSMSIPSGYARFGNYSAIAGQILNNIAQPYYWKNLLRVIFGHITYITIASLGCITFGFLQAVMVITQQLHERRKNDGAHQERSLFSIIYVCLSAVLILLMGAALFSKNQQVRIDQFFYGRYIETAVIVFLPIGIVRAINRKWMLATVVLVILTGLLLSSGLENVENINNQVNVIAFWPMLLHRGQNFLIWCLMGAAGVVLFYIMRNYQKYQVFFFAALFVLSMKNGIDFHQVILSTYSKPTSIVHHVGQDSNNPKRVAFDPEFSPGVTLHQIERYDLYSFYFYNSDYRRMTPSEWLASNYDYLLSFNIPDGFQQEETVRLVGRDINGLLLMAKTDPEDVTSDVDHTNIEYDFFLANDWDVNYRLFYGAEDLKYLPAQAGRYVDAKIVSNGQAESLFYMPYMSLPNGKYEITITGKANIPANAVVEVVAYTDEIYLKESILGGTGFEELKTPKPAQLFTFRKEFEINKHVNDLEIRCFVDGNTYLEIESLELRQVN